jgi:PEP-CTERM motif-containing protein
MKRCVTGQGYNRLGKFIIGVLVTIAATITTQRVNAGFSLGQAANYGILYEGGGGQTLSYNNSTENGAIGIGGTGKFAATSGIVNGIIQFAAANTGQYSASNFTLNPSANNPTYNNANVTSGLNTVNLLSHDLGLELGTSVVINNSGTPILAASGILDAMGNRVFSVTSVSFPNGTQTISGGANDFVVLNIPFSASLNGSIALTGGLTADHVLLNFTPSTSNLTNYNNAYTNLTGGPTMTISTSGLTTMGVFLDPTGNFQVNHSTINQGRIIGGDSVNSSFVSGNDMTAPPGGGVPEPTTISLLAIGAVGLATWRRRRA